MEAQRSYISRALELGCQPLEECALDDILCSSLTHIPGTEGNMWTHRLHETACEGEGIGGQPAWPELGGLTGCEG